MAGEELKSVIAQELDSIRDHVDDVVEEAVTYAMEKTERSLERLSNEKIMAVSEYSDTVLAEIHKNHEEAMFLYDMLNSKHDNLKNTVSEVNRTVKEAEETVMSFQKLKPQMAAAPEEKDASLAVQPQPERQRAGRQPKPETKKPETPKTDMLKPLRPQTEKSGLERLGAASESINLGKISFMQDVDDQGRNNNERILERFQQGKSTVAIARELGLGVGEVKLVIDLFKNQ